MPLTVFQSGCQFFGIVFWFLRLVLRLSCYACAATQLLCLVLCDVFASRPSVVVSCVVRCVRQPTSGCFALCCATTCGSLLHHNAIDDVTPLPPPSPWSTWSSPVVEAVVALGRAWCRRHCRHTSAASDACMFPTAHPLVRQTHECVEDVDTRVVCVASRKQQNFCGIFVNNSVNDRHRAPSTTHRAPHTEHPAPHTEHHTPSTERRTPVGPPKDGSRHVRATVFVSCCCRPWE